MKGSIVTIHQTVADKWLNVINDNYEYIKKGFRMECRKTMTDFDEDIFHDTILNCYKSIQTRGLTDLTEQGMKNYLFKAFKINIKRESVYARNSKRDSMDGDALNEYLDKIDGTTDTNEKIRRQLFNDWSVIRLLEIVEDNFDSVSFYCFRLKWLMPGMTYDRLRKITKVKDCKKRCMEIMHWCKSNLSIEVFEQCFDKEYV